MSTYPLIQWIPPNPKGSGQTHYNALIWNQGIFGIWWELLKCSFQYSYILKPQCCLCAMYILKGIVLCYHIFLVGLFCRFHSTLPNGRVKSTSWNSDCLSDWLSVRHFQYRAFKSSQNHVRPHISYIVGKRRTPRFMRTQERRSQRQRQRHRQRQRQSIKRTQHVLYFWKAQGARVLNMTFS